jgi:hypothetical protein
MNILIHCWPPITSIQDLSHSHVKKKMPSRNSSMQFLQNHGYILVEEINETYYFVQIYIIFLFEAQMV